MSRERSLKRHVSVTGIGSVEQAFRLKQYLASCLPGKPSQDQIEFGVGVLASRATLEGTLQPGNRMYPQLADLRSIFQPGAYNCLHYNSRDHLRLEEYLPALIARCGDHLRAVQVDCPWPPQAKITHAVRARDDLDVILRIGRNALSEVGNDPSKMVKKIGTYGSSVHRVLIDVTLGGESVCLPERIIPYIKAIQEGLPHIGVIISGRLGPETLQSVAPLLLGFPLSCDAHRGVLNGEVASTVDMGAATRYIRRAVDFMIN